MAERQGHTSDIPAKPDNSTLNGLFAEYEQFYPCEHYPRKRS